MNEICKTDNWKYAIEDIKAIIVEQGFISRLAFIKMKWLVGERICSDPLLLNHKKELAEELNVSTIEITRCINWYLWTKNKYNINSFEELEDKIDKNLSWHKIVNNLLPAPKDEQDLSEEKRLALMTETSRIRKIYKTLVRIQQENQFKSVEEFLDYLVVTYRIDVNKNY